MMHNDMPIDPMMQVAELLRGAADCLHRYGWGRGAAWNPRRRTLDLQGAVAVAAGARKEDFLSRSDPFECIPMARIPAALSAWESLDAHLGVNPTQWNDCMAASQDVVVNELLSLADLLEAGLGFLTEQQVHRQNP